MPNWNGMMEPYRGTIVDATRALALASETVMAIIIAPTAVTAAKTPIIQCRFSKGKNYSNENYLIQNFAPSVIVFQLVL